MNVIPNIENNSSIDTKRWDEFYSKTSDENNMEILEINIINNGKIEKNKLFLSEIEDEINLKIEIERTIYFSKSDNIFDSIVELRKKLELKNIYLLCNASVINVYPSGMQKEFGGAGVGLVSPVPPVYPPYGLTISPSRDWKFYSIMPAQRRKKTLSYGIIGSVSQFTTYGELADTTKVSAEVKVKRNLKAGRGMQFTRCNVLFSTPNASCRIGVFVNDTTEESHLYEASEALQRAILPVPTDAAKFVLQFTATATPNIYGISYETGYGVQVDNVPLRGSGGTDFSAISDTMLMQVNKVLAPKLVLLQFGVNVVPSQLTSYAHYSRQLQEQILRLKRLLPATAFILIGVSDMGLKEEEEFHSYSNIGLVRNAQRKAALGAGIAFWDSYAAMGGANSIIRWVNAHPPLATSDYVHFTPRGARYLAELFCTALLDVYNNPDSYRKNIIQE